MSEIDGHVRGSPGWHEANLARTLTFRLIPWHIMPGVFCGILMVWGAVYDADRWGVLQRIGILILGLLLAVASTKATVNRFVKIRIGDRLEFVSRRRTIDLPSTMATKVLVSRTWDIHSLSWWYIVVDDDGEEKRLLWAAHGLFGRRLNRRALAISKCLGVPIEDVKGAAYRQSWFLPLRFVAAGRDWLFHLSSVAIIGVPVVLAAALL